MKKITILSLVFFAFAILTAMPLVGIAQDYNTGDPNANTNDPKVTILSPNGTVFVPGFPATLPLTFTVQHPELGKTTVMILEITNPNGTKQCPLGTLDLVTNTCTAVGNPFNLDWPSNPKPATAPVTCASTLTSLVGVTCIANNTNLSPGPGPLATITAPLVAGMPGTYTMTASLKRTNDIGVETETVVLALMAVEYPAPPAVANAYINDKGYKLNAKRRGCVISRIAAGHTVEAYGDRGGPYNNPKIYADVETFLSTVCP